ncbi:MAG: DUF2269 family protein [Dehalococcoidia bacterium]|nr:DUF2269 family protein [Dehalococcoidia bacterium]
MDTYRIFLFLHILAVVLGLGVTFAYPFLQATAERSGTAATLFAHRAILRIETVLVYPGAALTFLFGLALMFNDYNSWAGEASEIPMWLNIAMLWFIVAFAVAIFYQRRNIQAAIGALEAAPAGPTLPDAYIPIGKRIQMVGGLLGLSIIAIAFLMVWGREGGF